MGGEQLKLARLALLQFGVVLLLDDPGLEAHTLRWVVGVRRWRKVVCIKVHLGGEVSGGAAAGRPRAGGTHAEVRWVRGGGACGERRCVSRCMGGMCRPVVVAHTL